MDDLRGPAMVVVGESVAEGVGRIAGFVNAFTFEDATGLYVIDTTISKTAHPVRKAFERAGVPLQRVGTILLSHQHIDHVRGARVLRERSRARVACHEADAPYVDGRLSPRMPWILRLFMGVPRSPVDLTVKDGDRVGPFQVVHVPGHTPGEVAFYHSERKLLFSGDSVIESKGRLTMGGPRVASDIREAVGSLQRLRRLEVELLLPGHGLPVRTDISGKLDELIARADREFLSR